MSAMLGLFNLLSLVYVVRSLQLTAAIWRRRKEVRQEPLTPAKQHLAEQASFFVAVPVGVLLHELGHALAVWGFGGQVVQFGYRFFWGFVVPQGSFTPFQNWFISLAGTLGSLLFGLAVWLLFRRSRHSALRYFGLRAFRFQVYFALIYYPAFTLLGFIGDWATIYNFNATPVWSGVTAVLHAGLLFLFWRGDRQGWFEMPAHQSEAAAAAFRDAAAAARRRPADVSARLRAIDALRQGGATQSARHALQQLLQAHPHSGLAHLELALVLGQGKRNLPRAAVDHARQALSLGLPHAVSEVAAHELLGRYSLDTGRLEEAVNHCDQAVALAGRAQLPPGRQAGLYHLRSRAYRQQRRFEQAAADLQQAREMARSAGRKTDARAYDDELALVARDAGRAPDAWAGSPAAAPSAGEPPAAGPSRPAHSGSNGYHGQNG